MIVYFALIDKESDREKFVALYEKYKKKMYHTAYLVLQDSYSAEDAVHEAFISVARNLDKIHSVDSAETAAYMCRAAKTRALNIYNAKKKETEQESFLEEGRDIPFDEPEFERICARSEVAEIAKCINQLPSPYRDVIVLRYLDDMPPREIASALGRKPDTIKKQLSRGRQMLKNMLEGGKE